jgi:predicted RecB family nuclease
VTERMLTPSKITAWLDCGAYLDLVRQVEGGTLELVGGGASSFARLLMDKGLEHELACLAHYEAQGLRVRRVPDRGDRETFAVWAARVEGALHDHDWDVLYQLPLVNDGIRGVADFLLRTTDTNGQVVIEPVDAKLARQDAKPGHVLQLAFYAEALEAATGTAPRNLHLWLGSGRTETLPASDVAAYWRRLRGQFRRLFDATTAEASLPEPCTHCAFCEFLPVCESRWREEDALHYVAGLRSHERDLLLDAGVPTLAALAVRAEPVDGLVVQRQPRLVTQAALQRQAREQDDTLPPPFLLVSKGEDPVWGHGMSLLPARDDGDVFLDFEGHPFWRADRGLFFLMGLIERSTSGEWEYRTWWAHDVDQEGRATSELIAHLAERRRLHPGMHVYHYNHTERSSLQRLAVEHGVGEAVLTELVETGAFVDLYEVARNAVQVGAESYGLKALERLTGFERGHDIDAGAGAVVSYEAWMATQKASHLAAIAAYNEDDVRATLAVRDWLVSQRPGDLPWRDAHVVGEETFPELDERVAQLHAFPTDSAEHLLGDLLGYWKRERSATITPILAACNGDAASVAEDPSLVGPLTCVGEVERLGKNGTPITPGMLFRFPPQDVSELEKNVLFPLPDGPPGFASVTRIEPEAGELELSWSAALAERGDLPTVVGPYTWVAARPKPDALLALADAVLDPAGEPNKAAMALLRREPPRFLPGHAPSAGQFTDDIEDMLRWTTGMAGTCVAVQGPPGTGKTYRGARQVHALVTAGKRVGITAFSHAAIDNLLRAVVELFEERGDAALLNAVRRNGTKGAVSGVVYPSGNSAAANLGVNVVAGSTWLFAGDDLADAPVDVLIVDEAGQLSLADTLAACRSARNLLLLGDPLQLPQVSVATHPGGSGASALEHLLGTDSTLPADRGVFITETRRMHPDVCRFISQNVYDGRLTSHASCEGQGTEFGTGLRWLRAEHDGCSTSSVAEVELVHAEVRRLLGTTWTDQNGAQRPLTVEDVLVVAPYNDHVALLRERFDADPTTCGLLVGSVDKFQGREAAVVFFTMATSNVEHIPRSSSFLFSRNRLNVAISRARCLAYLVCTEELLDTRARNVEEMRLLSTLCAFVEAVPVAVPRQDHARLTAALR